MTHSRDLAASVVLSALAEQLDWRGPSGRPLGHIVLPREQAQILLDYIMDLDALVKEGAEAVAAINKGLTPDA